MIGRAYEEEARKFLRKQGYEIVESNFRCSFGEIDIIAREKEYLVFLEVKFRSTIKKGYPEEAINSKKMYRIYRTAEYYLYSRNLSQEQSCRFDVVLINGQEIRLIRNAFGGFA